MSAGRLEKSGYDILGFGGFGIVSLLTIRLIFARKIGDIIAVKNITYVLSSLKRLQGSANVNYSYFIDVEKVTGTVPVTNTPT